MFVVAVCVTWDGGTARHIRTWYVLTWHSTWMRYKQDPSLVAATVSEFCAPNSAPISAFREFGPNTQIRDRKSWLGPPARAETAPQPDAQTLALV